MSYIQLIINPGSTSTKLALFRDKELLIQENISHDAKELHSFEKIADQIPYRMQVVRDFLTRNLPDEKQLSAVMGRGGLVQGLRIGGYEVDEDLCKALVDDHLSSPHASNLGGLLAYEVAKPLGIPAFIYDGVTSGKLMQVAKITGIPEIERRSFCHVLNSRAMAIRYAKEKQVPYEDLRLVVAHLGGGVSASVHVNGEIIDSVGDDDGQFSPERSGSVPSLELMELCYSGKYTYQEMYKKIRGRGGMYAHLGTSDCREIVRRINEGDEHAELIFEAQAYQIAKVIGLLSVALEGKCDAIILTGGLAYSQELTDRIRKYISFIAPIAIMPGENEMEALANGGLRMLSGQETVNQYHLPADFA